MSPQRSNPRPKFKVAIIGGGLSGLTLAVALGRLTLPGGKNEVEVEIYEAAPEFSEVGAGIGLGPNALSILKSIHVLDALINESQETCIDNLWFRYRWGGQGCEVVYDYPLREGDTVMSIHRASLLNALISSLPQSTSCHFNKRCVAIVQQHSYSTFKSPIHIYFADHTIAHADLVIGADGIKSIVRDHLEEGSLHRNGARGGENVAFSNCVVYRGLIPMEKVVEAGIKKGVEERPCLFVGKDKHLVVYPIKGGQLVNVVACVRDRSVPLQPARPEPWSTCPSNQHSGSLKSEYPSEDWGEEVVKLVEMVEEPSKWWMHVVYPSLGKWRRGRVAIIGDAAHAMLPHLSAGAGQGVEDAYVLARLLSHPKATLHNLEAILETFTYLRRPRVDKIWKGSLAAGNCYEGYGQSGYSVEGVRQDLRGIWDYVWYHDLERDIRRGEQDLFSDSGRVHAKL